MAGIFSTAWVRADVGEEEVVAARGPGQHPRHLTGGSEKVEVVLSAASTLSERKLIMSLTVNSPVRK